MPCAFSLYKDALTGNRTHIIITSSPVFAAVFCLLSHTCLFQPLKTSALIQFTCPFTVSDCILCQFVVCLLKIPPLVNRPYPYYLGQCFRDHKCFSFPHLTGLPKKLKNKKKQTMIASPVQVMYRGTTIPSDTSDPRPHLKNASLVTQFTGDS